MPLRFRKPLVILSLLLASLAARASASGRIAVAVSVPPQATVIERVGGAHVDVRVMIPAGATPPTYAPTPRQIANLQHAQAYLLVGHPAFLFERIHIRPQLARRPGIVAIDMWRESGADTGNLGSASDDPHLWLEPPRMERAAESVAAALSRIDPAHAEEYRANLARFSAELSELDRELKQLFANYRGRRLLLNHSAWNRFARYYGLQPVSLRDGGKEPGPRQLVRLIERERRAGTRCVFVQRGFPRKGAERLAEAIGARLVEIDPLARDWLDNLRRSAAAFARGLADG